MFAVYRHALESIKEAFIYDDATTTYACAACRHAFFECIIEGKHEGRGSPQQRVLNVSEEGSLVVPGHLFN